MVSIEPGVGHWVGKMEAGKNRCGFGHVKSILIQVYESEVGLGFFSGGLTENAQPWRGPRSYGVEVNTYFCYKKVEQFIPAF